MRRLIALTGMVAALGLAGCQDNTVLKRAIDENGHQIAALQDQVSKLSAENSRLTRELKQGSGDAPVGGANYDNEIMTLRETNARLEVRVASLENRKPGETLSKPETGPDAAPTPTKTDAEFEAALARVEAIRAEREKKERDKELQDIAAIAKGYGLEFDPKDPEGSLKKIMSNPETRQKAVEAGRDHMRKQRYKQVGMDEMQVMRVAQIEEDTRRKIGEIWRARDTAGLSREEVQRQTEAAFSDGNTLVKNLLSTEQYKTYSDIGGVQGSGGSWWGLEEVSKLFDGVKMDGVPDSGRRGRR